ncbi:MAG: sulfite exporter TauE/SafE family protein, partial [Acidobacteriales bacterium]|nr:sulfite exporter TauE/SafE family protein [Terriglobales bacterium]
EHSHDGTRWLAGAAAFQFGVAVYGGYFGAGIGILMLAALSLLGLTDIHQMNGLKNLFALCINVVATAYFMTAGLVEWPVAGTMALGAVSGGYGGAGLARRLGPRVVRQTVVAIGFAMTISLFIRQY